MWRYLVHVGTRLEAHTVFIVTSHSNPTHPPQLFDRIPLLTDVAQRVAFLDARNVQAHVLVPLPWLETVPEVHGDKERCVRVLCCEWVNEGTFGEGRARHDCDHHHLAMFASESSHVRITTAPSRPAAAPTPRPRRWSGPTQGASSGWRCYRQGTWRIRR